MRIFVFSGVLNACLADARWLLGDRRDFYLATSSLDGKLLKVGLISCFFARKFDSDFGEKGVDVGTLRLALRSMSMTMMMIRRMRIVTIASGSASGSLLSAFLATNAGSLRLLLTAKTLALCRHKNGLVGGVGGLGFLACVLSVVGRDVRNGEELVGAESDLLNLLHFCQIW